MRAAEILRLQPGGAMAALQLHEVLSQEFGDQAGTYADMVQMLKHRPQSFMILDPPYASALQDAGLGTGPKVVLIEMDAESTSAVAVAGRTLTSLWGAAQGDDELRAYLSSALEQLVEIGQIMDCGAEARPTTRPRDPR